MDVIGVDSKYEEPIFESCHNALMFSFQHIDASPHTLLSSLVSSNGDLSEKTGKGKGLSGLYALEVAGGIMIHVCKLMTAEKNAIIARHCKRRDVIEKEVKVNEFDCKEITVKQLSDYINVSVQHIRNELSRKGNFYGLIPRKDKNSIFFPASWRSVLAERYGLPTGYAQTIKEESYSKQFIEAVRLLSSHPEISILLNRKDVLCVLISKYFGAKQPMEELAQQSGVDMQVLRDVNRKVKDILNDIEQSALTKISDKLQQRGFI